MPRLNSYVQLLAALNGQPEYLGTIQSTGTVKTNANTSSTFTLTTGSVLLVQPDGAGYLLAGSVAATASNGLKLGADDRFYLVLGEGTSTLQWISSSGTTNLKVWRVQ